MTFRAKLLLICSLTVTGSVSLVTVTAVIATRRAFERLNASQRIAVLKQFEREVRVQGIELSTKVQRASASEAIRRIASEASKTEPDFASFYTSAQAMAEANNLDFLDITRKDSTILSSSYWPARFGYKLEWGICAGCDARSARLVRIPVQDGSSAVALAVMRAAENILLFGARRLDPAFLRTLGEVPGVRLVLWLSSQNIFDAQGPVFNPAALNLAAEHAVRGNYEPQRIGNEVFLALPLKEQGRTVAILLAGSSLREQIDLEHTILWMGVWIGSSGILLGVLLSWRASHLLTRPVQQLVGRARAVAAGNWSARVDAISSDEIGELARAFNHMTGQLVEQRERAIQAERVAAWRELARRLAHELKNPLFPIQITIENLQRAKLLKSTDFEEVFRESTATLLEEVKGLQTIIGRFSEFARMPAPLFEPVRLNEILRKVVKLYGDRLEVTAQVKVVLELPAGDIVIEADPDQLQRAFGNLVLNAGDAMTQGGTLTIRTAICEDCVRVEFSDTGEGLTEEERERLFTPYYTTKQHGTGLGLAIVQTIVTGHHGRISVESQPKHGATFRVEFPTTQPPRGERA